MRDRPMGTVVVRWKTNGATLGKSLRTGAIAMPLEPAFNRTHALYVLLSSRHGGAPVNLILGAVHTRRRSVC